MNDTTFINNSSTHTQSIKGLKLHMYDPEEVLGHKQYIFHFKNMYNKKMFDLLHKDEYGTKNKQLLS